MDSELSGASDSELVARLRSRDQAALALLYDRYGRALYSLVLRITCDGAAAEEITQEVFLHLWQYPHLYEADRGAFHPWFLRAARNRAIDCLRRRQRQRALIAQAQQLVWAMPEDDPVEVVQLNDAAVRLRQALAELAPEQRWIIELAYFGGLTQREIAAQLQVPLGTVKSRLRAALRKLAEALTGEPERWTP